jgi:YHS domain-containing protein
MKETSFCILPVAISSPAPAYRWGDSAHSIGVVNKNSGAEKYPAVLDSGKNGHTLIATATVIPPYSGNVRVFLEGDPKIAYTLSLSNPVIDLGVRKLPDLRKNMICDLQPWDRFALWVDMKPPAMDPVCGMTYQDGFIKHHHNGKDYYFCSSICRSAFLTQPKKFQGNESLRSKYTLAFYDSETGRNILRVPIIFKGKGGTSDTRPGLHLKNPD